jgi:hypothetical protein
MSTAIPGIGGPGGVGVAADGIDAMPGMLDCPGIPTDVPPFDAKSTVGVGAFAGAAHPATPIATATQASAVLQWCMNLPPRLNEVRGADRLIKR